MQGCALPVAPEKNNLGRHFKNELDQLFLNVCNHFSKLKETLMQAVNTFYLFFWQKCNKHIQRCSYESHFIPLVSLPPENIKNR